MYAVVTLQCKRWCLIQNKIAKSDFSNKKTAIQLFFFGSLILIIFLNYDNALFNEVE